jgi:hypothetical protein
LDSKTAVRWKKDHGTVGLAKRSPTDERMGMYHRFDLVLSSWTMFFLIWLPLSQITPTLTPTTHKQFPVISGHASSFLKGPRSNSCFKGHY